MSCPGRLSRQLGCGLHVNVNGSDVRSWHFAEVVECDFPVRISFKSGPQIYLLPNLRVAGSNPAGVTNQIRRSLVEADRRGCPQGSASIGFEGPMRCLIRSIGKVSKLSQ